MSLLPLGAVFANRFEILRTAGAGGMGTVYRAIDRFSGEPVALKLLQSGGSDPHESERFSREAQLLSELRHPGIVSYVAHGQTVAGQLFLAMEWLEGCDFAQRLSEGALPLRDAFQLLRQVAKALAVAHARNILHRDIKPTNLFLPSGEIEQVKLLDFGIARRVVNTKAMTGTGTVIGTPEYMAPEQARGVRELTPAADIFALGCVLYECLSGEPPFVAEHIAAVLVRILFEDPVPISAKRPGMPEAVTALLDRMLHKDPAQRFADATDLLQHLEAVEDLAEMPNLPTLAMPSRAPASFAQMEQELFSLVVASAYRSDAALDSSLPSSRVHLDAARQAALLVALHNLGVRADFLVDGGLACTVPQTGSATDQAGIAARVALLVRERWPEAAVAVATGRGAAHGTAMVGEVADRVARLLQQRLREHPSGPVEVAGGVWLDSLTTRLLGPRFAVTTTLEGSVLLGEDKAVDESRRLMGKPTPCVGRDVELSMMEAQLDGCLDAGEPRVVVITAHPGVGKSRLCHEFLRRVEKRGETVTTLVGRADMTSAGAPYGILAAAIRRLCGLSGSEPLEVQQQQLATRLAKNLPAAAADGVTAYIGELCNIPLPEATRPTLRAARRDPRLMRDCMRRAWLDFLHAECAAAAVLLVLDDLHWGDALTVSIINEALHELRGAPLLVLALARPELETVFPQLWQDHRPQAIPLRPLSKKACERLIVQVLGKNVPGPAIARAIEQSAGNALFLEELIRLIAQGGEDEQSDTVIAMLQARIGRLEAGPRRAVRAAAVFGQTFWRGGVATLLGLSSNAPEAEQWLAELLHAELIHPSASSRLALEPEYGFRHALVREAAYGLLAPADLTTGHRLAGEFLDSAGEQDAAMIADHFVQGGEPGRAVTHYLQAGENATRLCAYDEARRHFAAALTMLQQLPQTVEVKRQTVDALLMQVRAAHIADQPKQNQDRLAEATALLQSLPSNLATSADDLRLAWVNYWRARIHYYGGESRESLSYCQHVLAAAREHQHTELLMLASAASGTALFDQGRVDLGEPLLASTLDFFATLGRGHEWVRSVGHRGLCLVGLGEYERGMAEVYRAHARALEINKPITISMTHIYHAMVSIHSGDWPTMLLHAQKSMDVAKQASEMLYQFLALGYLACANNQLGRHEEAATYYTRVQETARAMGGRLLLLHVFTAVYGEILLNQGRLAEAILHAREMSREASQADTCSSWGIAERTWGIALHRGGSALASEVDGHMEASTQAFLTGSLRLDVARTQLAWAIICRERGERARGQELLDQCRAQFRTAGCSHSLVEVQQLTSAWD